MLPAALPAGLLAVLISGGALAQDPIRGRDLYLNAAAIKGLPGAPSCVQCHGLPPDGKLLGASAAQLAGAFSSVIAMAPFALLLDARDLADLSAYLSQTEATDTPLPRVMPAAVRFAAASGTASPSVTVELENAGRAVLRLDAAAPLQVVGDADAFDIDAGSCVAGAALAPGARCRFALRFNAGSGAASAQMRLRYADIAAPTTLSLHGEPVLAPALTVSAPGLSFGSIAPGASSSASLRLINSGQETLRLDALRLDGPAAGDFTVGAGCPGQLAAGADCTLGVEFAPRAAGPRSAALVIIGNVPVTTVALSGDGRAAQAPPAAPPPAPPISAATGGGGGATAALLSVLSLLLHLAAAERQRHLRRRNAERRSGNAPIRRS